MRTDAIFIGIEVADDAADDPALAAKLEETCPVDIYTDADGHVELVEHNIDECILCDMCVAAAAARNRGRPPALRHRGGAVVSAVTPRAGAARDRGVGDDRLRARRMRGPPRRGHAVGAIRRVRRAGGALRREGVLEVRGPPPARPRPDHDRPVGGPRGPDVRRRGDRRAHGREGRAVRPAARAPRRRRAARHDDLLAARLHARRRERPARALRRLPRVQPRRPHGAHRARVPAAGRAGDADARRTRSRRRSRSAPSRSPTARASSSTACCSRSSSTRSASPRRTAWRPPTSTPA